MTTAPPESPRGFEESIQALEALVSRMESESLSLEESLAHYQRGLELVRLCQDALENAQRQVASTLPQVALGATAKDSKNSTIFPEIAGEDGDDAPR
jgi:exodeoxyribonuclease VII small subunit